MNRLEIMLRIIGGSRRTRRLGAPIGRKVRPTSERVREAIFNILQHNNLSGQSLKGAKALDLFAGTGALGLEALSRGANYVTCIENDRAAIACITKNVETLGFEAHVNIIQADATNLPKAHPEFDYVFLDPPYGHGYSTPALCSIDQGKWLKNEAIVILESSENEVPNIPSSYESLKCRVYGTTTIHILRYIGSSTPK